MLLGSDQTFYHAEYFLFGIAVAANRHRIAALASRWKGWAAVGALTIGCLMWWLPWPVEHDRMVGVGAAIILAGILASERAQGWLTNKPLLWLGRQSYSLYLIHVPLLMVVVIAFNGVVPIASFCVVIPAIIACAEVFRRRVEMPSVALAQRMTGYSTRPKGGTRKPPGGMLRPSVGSGVL
jgi:peptidoglycan/LPS O-acetylase OafA/YrhL